MAFFATLVTSCFRDLKEPSGTNGGFIQIVTIYSNSDPAIFRRVTAVLDTGNNGPNLITQNVMDAVGAQSTGDGVFIETLDGGTRMTGGKVVLEFSGYRPRQGRLYKETFHHVPYIAGGFDIVLNYDFFTKAFPKMVPPVLMIRSCNKKEKKEQKQREQQILAQELQQKQNAEQQERARQQDVRILEERRLAQGGDSGESNSG
ncbi:hypothetical protein HYALB_00009359 [Hymenoscyphus albidus]|uniref:Uncharacterized protein n=1 Tax=Hymenoscyphus albidus TaxID=595503 RepID=A0A9N9LQ14_9HELO|nr:hypothetical protein HYALB_00009359 [Hymenoscyphus albidus]